MNFRIIEYKCGCRYVWLNGTKRPPKCIEHGAVQHEITLWCRERECNKKLIVSPLSGRRKRCYKCSEYQRKRNVQKRNNRICNKKHGIEKEPTSETLRETEERETDVWYQECRERLNLAIPDTPILEGWMNE